MPATNSAVNGIEFRVEPSSEPRSDAERREILANPGWGRFFTDHMVTVGFDPEQGWHDAVLRPFEQIPMSPATSVLHYGQAVFEGLKAYRQPDGSVAAFRPLDNARRFAASARRLAMPALPEPAFVDAIRLLVGHDRDWVPTQDGHSLYLRPLEIATDADLMTRPSRSYLFALIASPVASYFQQGIRPVTVWLNTDYPRACPGGTGAAKFGGNYAAGMLGQALAADNGCEQVVWLDSAEHRFVEEMGGMNIFFVTRNGGLITPPLNGTILPGVTRESILTLGKEIGLSVEERPVTIEEWENSAASGEITEAFACGTAAVITPIGAVKHANGSFRLDSESGQPGHVASTLRRRLLGIQQGHEPDPHGWMTALIPSGD